MNTTTVQSPISETVCQQRRDRLVAELKSLSEVEMRELGVWSHNIDTTVEQIIGQMGCPASS